METECSLPCSQQIVTGPYPELDDSSPPPSSLSPYFLRYISTLPFRRFLGIPSGPFTSGFPTETLYAFNFSPIRTINTVHLILFNWITIIQNLVDSTNYEGLHCVILPVPVRPFSCVSRFSVSPHRQTRSIYVPRLLRETPLFLHTFGTVGGVGNKCERNQ